MRVLMVALSAVALSAQTPVLVELFTSEGCSSCPPADALLASIHKAGAASGVEVIALSEHVDYWNQLGWRDPFSSSEFTARQQNYARRLGLRGPYTPQMVVDGRWEFVGSDRSRLGKALTEAAKTPKPRVGITLDGPALKLTVPGGVQGDAWLAITEDGLSVDVPRGENTGRKLRHEAVTRRLAKLGKGAAFTEPWKPDPQWKGALRAVAFVTDAHGTVVAAGALRIP
ncbi:MAG: DUF1223 domain-containing protein [Bryobacteraceae bacterium]